MTEVLRERYSASLKPHHQPCVPYAITKCAMGQRCQGQLLLRCLQAGLQLSLCLQVTKKVQKTAKKVAPKVPTGARKTVR